MSKIINQLDDVIVVKIGTTTMFKHEDGREVLDHDSFSCISQQILNLMSKGHHVSIVSSGAVTAGMEKTHTSERPTDEEAMPEIQRLATIGWHEVLSTWEKALGVSVGGLLVTKRELNLDTPEHDEALRTTYTLLNHGNVPILNENDGITHAELSHQSFGQNDTLAAIYAAQIAGSDLFGRSVRLVLLSDVDGVYEDINDSSSVISEISELGKYEHLAGGSGSDHGKGGMKTKFEAAKIALDSGVEVWVANGRADNVIHRTLDGQIGTHFTL
jgi:glutamate 5-kinase